jgi:hypothetical protein
MSGPGRIQSLFRSGANSLGKATGWREVTATAGDIRAMGRALRKGSEEVGTVARDGFDIETIAARHKLSPQEVIRRMENRRKETKWVARTFGAGVLFCLVNEIVSVWSSGPVSLSTLPLAGLTLMLMVGLLYNALLNWQMRLRCPVTLRAFLRHPNEWWPS